MSNQRLLTALGMCLVIIVASAQTISVNPTPQQMVETGKSIAMPSSFRLNGSGEAAPNAVKVLEQTLQASLADEGMELCIGERGDKAVRKYAKRIPGHAEGYYLEISDKRIVLAGNDNRGTFYAVQTLRQLMCGPDGNLLQQLPLIRITDYPDVAVRGVVEGFYGTPWKQEARMSQLDFYGRYKMNTYIFGPKNDPYHSSPKWRQPYPEAQANDIRKLVNHAHENEVDFVWAIHPGRDIKWNDEDRDKVMEKFQHMYDLGVRSFAVFFDDISGSGTNAKRQVELLNYLDEHFVKAKGDVKPLIMCPTQYNRGRVKPETGYMDILGPELSKDIHIMWTGDRALSDITRDNLEWTRDVIKRKPYIWWNFPVTDFSHNRILMGRVCGVDRSIDANTSAFVSNPMEYAEASKVALYSVADLTWNPSAYDEDASWHRSVFAAMPGAAEAFECFCAHSSATGEGHFVREESEYLLPLIRKIEDDYIGSGTCRTADMGKIRQEFGTMMSSAQTLLLDGSNIPLRNEIRSWLICFGALGRMGQSVIDMAMASDRGDKAAFEEAYRSAKFMQQNIRELNRRPLVGSMYVQPFIRSVFTAATKRFNERFQVNWDDSIDNAAALQSMSVVQEQ